MTRIRDFPVSNRPILRSINSGEGWGGGRIGDGGTQV